MHDPFGYGTEVVKLIRGRIIDSEDCSESLKYIYIDGLTHRPTIYIHIYIIHIYTYIYIYIHIYIHIYVYIYTYIYIYTYNIYIYVYVV